MASVNPLVTEKVCMENPREETPGSLEQPLFLHTSTEVFQYLTITSTAATCRTDEQERKFTERNEDCLGPDDAF